MLGVQSYKPTEFANQINLNDNNMWAILKNIIDICMALEPGTYVLLKDPNKVPYCALPPQHRNTTMQQLRQCRYWPLLFLKRLVRLYQVPSDSFIEGTGEEEDGDEDENYGDYEDGADGDEEPEGEGL